MLKRVYNGEVSELFGEDYYSLDLYWKTEYPTMDELKASFESFDEKYKIIIRSYADGINAWIDEVMNDLDKKLPLEFHEFGILPEHWDEMDVAAAIMANLGVFMDLTNEMIYTELYTYLLEKFGDCADDYFNDMAWIDDSSAYTTIQREDQNGSDLANASIKDSQISMLNKKGLSKFTKIYSEKEKNISELLAILGFDIPTKIKEGATEAMSYCVVVDPEKSETGNPWLMAGLQVDWWVSSLIYEVGLHGAGFDELPSVHSLLQ